VSAQCWWAQFRTEAQRARRSAKSDCGSETKKLKH
jgi:hypothetical protein